MIKSKDMARKICICVCVLMTVFCFNLSGSCLVTDAYHNNPQNFQYKTLTYHSIKKRHISYYMYFKLYIPYKKFPPNPRGLQVLCSPRVLPGRVSPRCAPAGGAWAWRTPRMPCHTPHTRVHVGRVCVGASSSRSCLGTFCYSPKWKIIY